MIRERGVALIVVLLLLSMAVLVSAQLIEALESSRTRTENALLMEQNLAYLMSAEALALRALQVDLEKDRRERNPVDACTEKDWALRLGPVPWDNGLFSVSIQDLQGRLNLTSLAAGSASERALSRPAVERLKRLLRQVLPDATAADALAEEAADWTDSNALVDGLGGAEDTEYPDRRTSNQPFAHVSELRALRSATMALWKGTDEYPSFTRYIAALPDGVKVNVNTAPPEVLAALVPGMTTGIAEAIVQARERDPIATVDALMALQEIRGLQEADRKELKEIAAVSSEYFQVMSEVQIGDRRARMVSVIHRPRQGGSPVVVMRDLGATFGEPEGACNPGWVEPEKNP